MCHAPENSLAAFEKAIEFGTYRIEFDVRRSRDHQIVLMHDATVDRTTNGSGRVADMTLEELRQLKVGGSEPVPTLLEALECARGRCRLLVELKDTDITDRVVEIIAAAGMIDACTISAFDEHCLRRAKEIHPELSTAYFFLEPGEFSARKVVDGLGVDLLIVWPRAATPEHIAAAKRCGLHVRCGFADNMSYKEAYEVFKGMVDMGVDEISCGRPDWIGRMIDRYYRDSDSKKADWVQAPIRGRPPDRSG